MLTGPGAMAAGRAGGFRGSGGWPGTGRAPGGSAGRAPVGL